MNANKNMLIVSALVIIVLVGIFAFTIYNDTKVVKINSADIIVTEKPGIMEDEKIITVDAGERVIFYSFDGGNTYQTDNSYTISKNQSVHIVLQDSDKRVIGEKYYNEAYFVDVTRVILNKVNLKLVVGESGTLSATINPSNATDQKITWSSSDTDVATVENGEVTGKKAGTAVITATANNGKKMTCKVTVIGENNHGGGSSTAIDVTEISLNKQNLKLAVGKTETLTTKISPSNATDKGITWSTTDASVATVDKGKVHAKKAGTATIIATSRNGKTATCDVIVTSGNVTVADVNLNISDLKLVVGQNETLIASVSPSDATDKSITWSSSNTGVATVDKGKVHAKKAGTTTITATSDNGKKATCKVTVTSNNGSIVAVTGVNLNISDLKLIVGKTETLTATISPGDATDKSITWSSSDTSVATVSNGKVTAKKSGTAIITATSNNGKKATCKLTVSSGTVAVTGVSLNISDLKLVVGQSETLIATISPSNATNKAVSWSSSDGSIATVENGKVNAKKAGVVTITATSNNGKTATCKVTVNNPTIAVTGVSLNKTSLSLAIGNSETLTATISPSNATNKAVSWSSSDTSVATVSNGKITAKKSGTATITATSNNGKKATCKVTVSNTTVAVTGVGLNKTNLILTVGGSEELSATISPSNATNKAVSWSSSDTSVATISNGRVTGKKAGTATITVTTNNGKTATCKVIILSKQRLINVNNMSFYTYIKKMKLYSGELASGENFQNFGFKNFNQPGETIYVSNKYKGNGGKEQTKLRIANIDNNVIKYDDKKSNNITKYTTKLLLSNYYSHGQAFDVALSPNGDQWLMFLTAATEPDGAQYLRVFRDSEQTAFKEYPNLKGQPSIDRENDLIAMVNGTNCKIYKYSDLINNNKETLLYNFNFSRYTTAGGKEYTNGFAIKDGYLYEIRGCYGDNGIEVWDYSGTRVIYRDIPLVSGKNNEPQGIHIYDGTIYIGITEFPADYNASGWTYTVGYLQ